MRKLSFIALLFTGPLWSFAQAPMSTPHPKKGLIDLLMEYMEVRYPEQALAGDLLYISVQRQALFHVNNGVLLNEYPVATASKGLGAQVDSYQTPTGLHRVSEKFGDDVPPFGILKDRVFTGEFADPDFAGVDKDWITSRILWLSGLEPGVNQGVDPETGQVVDSHDRYIYIHGTANERSVGAPTSMGCIRMRNADVIELCRQVPVGALVVVLDN